MANSGDGGPWGWRTLGMANSGDGGPGDGGPWGWRTPGDGATRTATVRKLPTKSVQFVDFIYRRSY
jgi:hypothetical protein